MSTLKKAIVDDKLSDDWWLDSIDDATQELSRRMGAIASEAVQLTLLDKSSSASLAVMPKIGRASCRERV